MELGAASPAVEIEWIWGTPRGYILQVDGRACGPMSFTDLKRFPTWLFRRLSELDGYELRAALAVSRRLSELERGQWQRLLVRCDNILVAWPPRRSLMARATTS